MEDGLAALILVQDEALFGQFGTHGNLGAEGCPKMGEGGPGGNPAVLASPLASSFGRMPCVPRSLAAPRSPGGARPGRPL